jgi:RimJ/RimL family protein N-acetyltransferase
MEGLILTGSHIRLEPLNRGHIAGLVAAASADTSLYQWSPVPRTEADTRRYVELALSWQDAGTALPFATVRMRDGLVIGSTRFWNLERWAWPQDHPEYGRRFDACEIGHTWLTRSAVRTAANTEAKLLMLTHAFEAWRVRRVCLHTDVRNLRSRAAIERIGGKFEGILRAHRLAADLTPRDSARFSILESEWPDAKRRLTERLNRQ